MVYDKEKDDAAMAGDEQPTFSDMTKEFRPLSIDVMKSVNKQQQKTNPLAAWRVSNREIYNMAFSPDDVHLALVSEDGTLRIVNFLEERMLDIHRSYYGGIICVAWSPDGKYLVTGGQDDIVSIWSFEDRALVARCQGHSGWVRDVKFDPWRCDAHAYRIGSVGDDCKLLLWDFALDLLRLPKVAVSPQVAFVFTLTVPDEYSTARQRRVWDRQHTIERRAHLPRSRITSQRCYSACDNGQSPTTLMIIVDNFRPK